MCGTEGVLGLKPWDIAAGGLLVREAGARATSTEGDEEFLLTGTIVVPVIPRRLATGAWVA